MERAAFSTCFTSYRGKWKSERSRGPWSRLSHCCWLVLERILKNSAVIRDVRRAGRPTARDPGAISDRPVVLPLLGGLAGFLETDFPSSGAG